MAELADLARRGAILVLARLHEVGTLQMEEFTEAAQVTSQVAKRLREDLRGLGLIRVEEIPVRGVTRQYRVELTDLGRDVAQHLAKAGDVLRKRGTEARGGRRG